LQSHAGVLSTLSTFDVTLFDPDIAAARKAASALQLRSIEQIDESALGELQCAIVCSPTPTHFDYLSRLMAARVPLVVCEKPVCFSAEEAKKLMRLRRNSKTRVLVNYTRRFQPSYAKLREHMIALLKREQLTSILVRYQRGFLNNASHALDLVQFLTGWSIRRAKVRIVESENDQFPDDPTLSCHGSWNGALLSIVGLPDVRFSFFEIDFFFRRSAVRLRDRGDTIEVSGSAPPDAYYAPLETKTKSRNNLREPLKHLYRHVDRMLGERRLRDNFDESIELADWSFQVLKGK